MKFLLAVIFLLPSVHAQDPPEPPEAPKYSETLGAGELLLLTQPGVVTDPLDFGQIAREKLAVFSSQGMSWAASRFRVEGMDATDPYQPGRPLLFADPGGVAEFHVDQYGLDGAPTLSYTFRTAEPKWHFLASGFFTGSPLSSSNLPPPNQRGTLQRSDEFQNFAQPHFDLGGPITHWLDFFFSGTGRWSNQTAPLDVTNLGIYSHDLDATIRANIRPNAKNRIDLLILAARANDSAWSLPFGLEALSSRSAAFPITFQSNLREEDHLDYVQTGWHRTLLGGDFEARYGYTARHANTVAGNGVLPGTYLDVVMARLETVYVDQTNGATHGGPLLQTETVQPQQEGLGAWRKTFRHNGITHSLSLTGSLSRVVIKNRFENPPLTYAVTADGVPASAIILNTAVEPTSVVRHLDLGFEDQVRLGSRVTVSGSVTFSAWNGGTPAQGIPLSGGPLLFAARPDLIVWNNTASRFGISWRVPGVNALTLRSGLWAVLRTAGGALLGFRESERTQRN